MIFKQYREATCFASDYPEYDALEYLIPSLCAKSGKLAGEWAYAVAHRAFAEEDTLFENTAATIKVRAAELLWHIDQLGYHLGFTIEDLMKEAIQRDKQN